MLLIAVVNHDRDIIWQKITFNRMTHDNVQSQECSITDRLLTDDCRCLRDSPNHRRSRLSIDRHFKLGSLALHGLAVLEATQYLWHGRRCKTQITKLNSLYNQREISWKFNSLVHVLCTVFYFMGHCAWKQLSYVFSGQKNKSNSHCVTIPAETMI